VLGKTKKTTAAPKATPTPATAELDTQLKAADDSMTSLDSSLTDVDSVLGDKQGDLAE
jgi:hypothetical protein